MHLNKFILFLLFGIMMASSCINPFYPDIESGDESQVVVGGGVASGEEVQTVNVSISSPIDNPRYIPLLGCNVRIMDHEGHDFQMQDQGDGNYTTVIDSSFLTPGRSFMVDIMTPGGDHLVSGFDTLYSSAHLQDVYYQREDIEGNTPEQVTKGIQFYADMEGEPGNSQYYRWDVTETWEYHAMFPVEWYYNGSVQHVFPPDSSRMFCWTTKKVPTIFTLTTTNLSEIRYNQFPLHYVNNMTERLVYGYSVLVEQHAMSAIAFRYWQQQQLNSVQEGGLYEKQPISVKGNMRNLTHPGREVLGFFGVTTVESQRLFIDHVDDLELFYTTYCDWYFLRNGLKEIKPPQYPGYLLRNELTGGYTLNLLANECVNCLLLGGINVKPSFWPN